MEAALASYENSMEASTVPQPAKSASRGRSSGNITGEGFEAAFVEKFPVGSQVSFAGELHSVEVSEKPFYEEGEGKTDVYLGLRSPDGVYKEVKISLKKDNADFLENKLTLARAVAIFGSEEAVEKLTDEVYGTLGEKLEGRQVDFTEKSGRTEAGSYTVGWRMDITTRKTGELSAKLPMTEEQLMHCYSGTNLIGNRRDAEVAGRLVKDSGVATHFLRGKPEELLKLSPEELLVQVETVEDHVKAHPEVFVKLSALNYRESKGDVTSYSAAIFGVNRATGRIEKVALKKRADQLARRELEFMGRSYTGEGYHG